MTHLLKTVETIVSSVFIHNNFLKSYPALAAHVQQKLSKTGARDSQQSQLTARTWATKTDNPTGLRQHIEQKSAIIQDQSKSNKDGF